MSWHYLQALVEESSEGSCSDGEPSAPSSLSPTAGRSCSNGNGTDSCPHSPSGTMSRPSTGDPGVDAWMSSLEGSHARTSPPPGREQASTVSDLDSGVKWPGSWVTYSRDTSSWKTRQFSLLGDLDAFSGTWPRWGTMRDGECWAQDMPEHLTSGTESGLWQTPVADDAVNRTKGKINSRGEPKLSAEVLMWPTPSTAPARPNEGNVRLLRQKVLNGDMTEGEAKQMLNGKSPFESQGAVKAWPTPTARDWRSGKASPETHARNARPLSEVMGNTTPGALNPDWVEWLMGWPVGWTSLEPMAGLDDWFSEAWWGVEPVPRVTTDKTNRSKRLRAIGNGQVPACVVMAWRLLVTDES